MKLIKFICSLVVVLLVTSAFTPKDHNQKGVYIVGVSASFTDSLIYFTDVQFVEGAKMKKKLLYMREFYSAQLKDYLEFKEGLTNRTCFVYFSDDQKKLNKKINKMKIRYQKGDKLLIRQVNPNAFAFTNPENEVN